MSVSRCESTILYLDLVVFTASTLETAMCCSLSFWSESVTFKSLISCDFLPEIDCILNDTSFRHSDFLWPTFSTEEFRLLLLGRQRHQGHLVSSRYRPWRCPFRSLDTTKSVNFAEQSETTSTRSRSGQWPRPPTWDFSEVAKRVLRMIKWTVKDWAVLQRTSFVSATPAIHVSASRQLHLLTRIRPAHYSSSTLVGYFRLAEMSSSYLEYTFVPSVPESSSRHRVDTTRYLTIFPHWGSIDIRESRLEYWQTIEFRNQNLNSFQRKDHDSVSSDQITSP